MSLIDRMGMILLCIDPLIVAGLGLVPDIARSDCALKIPIHQSSNQSVSHDTSLTLFVVWHSAQPNFPANQSLSPCHDNLRNKMVLGYLI